MAKEIEIPEGYEAKIENNKVIFVPKESEDEKIRKELLEEIEFIIPHDDETDSEGLMLPSYHARIDRYKSYLEKQKEQKPAVEQLDGTFNSYDMAKTFVEGQYYVMEHPERFGLCKPVEWSDEDKRMIDNIIYCLPGMAMGTIEMLPSLAKQYALRLKSLFPSWKPSEQEKGALRTAIHILTEERNFPRTGAQLQNILNAFEGKESRKDWKPSEEQMEILQYVCTQSSHPNQKVIPVLESLYNDLKKL